MNKRLIKIFALILTVINVVAFCFSMPLQAASDTTINFSKSNVTVGENVTVTVTISGTYMTGSDMNINYNSEILNYVSGADSGGSGKLRIVDQNLQGEARTSYKLQFVALKTGSCTVSVSGVISDGIPATDKQLAGASATLTVKDVELSSNANLKSLSVSNGSLSPKFSASNTSYTVKVDNSVTSCKIYANAAESGAKIAVGGASTLKVGDNVRTVTVTAPSGAQKTYTITVTRAEKDEIVSEPVESEPTDNTPNPLETNVDGNNYYVAVNIDNIVLFNGFTAEKATFNNTEVAVARDSKGEFEIYYLSTADNSTLIPYTYNNEKNTFEKLSYYTQGKSTYIFTDIPENRTMPEGYYATTTKIGELDLPCFAANNNEAMDFYYFYCYTDSQYGIYRYDSREGVLQRFPELKLLSADDITDKKEVEGGLARKFAALSANGKILIIAFVTVILVVIALVVLLIIKLFVRRDDYFDEGIISDDDFENIITNSNFSAADDSIPEDSKITNTETQD